MVACLEAEGTKLLETEPMNEVDRYDLIVSNAGNYMEIREDGDWIEYDDYERLAAINAELEAILRRINRMDLGL